MTKKKLKLLAKASYTREKLDFKKTKRVANFLNRSDLKQYIRELKKFEQGKTVRVALPNTKMLSVSSLNRVQNCFPKKRLIIKEDPSLLLGLTVIDNDLIYNLSLRDIFTDLNQYLLEKYD